MFETLDTFDTKFSADSVEWCPAEGFEDVFVCGTYQLSLEQNEALTACNKVETKKRIGRIYVFRVITHHKSPLHLLQQLDTAAVLDMKWLQIKYFDDAVLLGVVNAEGFLQIYELIKEEENISLKLKSEILVNDAENVLALSLDWSAGRRSNSDRTDVKITVSDSRGSISLFKLSKNGIEKIMSWDAHEYEAWITAFDYWNTNVIYTGGDDCKFLRFDARAADSSCPTNTNRSHTAGVTSLHCNWNNEFCLVSGSYDESLRKWDSRNFLRPLAEVNLNGGVWRLKWNPHESKYLLAACMYNGFCIVDCDHLNNPKIVAEYKEHESIAYGCDWSRLSSQHCIRADSSDQENTTLVGTCSFYDHILKLSSVKLTK